MNPELLLNLYRRLVREGVDPDIARDRAALHARDLKDQSIEEVANTILAGLAPHLRDLGGPPESFFREITERVRARQAAKQSNPPLAQLASTR